MLSICLSSSGLHAESTADLKKYSQAAAIMSATTSGNIKPPYEHPDLSVNAVIDQGKYIAGPKTKTVTVSVTNKGDSIMAYNVPENKWDEFLDPVELEIQFDVNLMIPFIAWPMSTNVTCDWGADEISIICRIYGLKKGSTKKIKIYVYDGPEVGDLTCNAAPGVALQLFVNLQVTPYLHTYYKETVTKNNYLDALGGFSCTDIELGSVYEKWPYPDPIKAQTIGR